MRFFAHDGKAVHGPSAVKELLKLPGFDGDTLVCPVGSENSTDWKPALAYPPFREALLAAAPKLAPPPSRPLPTLPCPRCARANPEDARFCNACAARMDGREEPPAPAPEPAAAPEPSPAFFALDPLVPPSEPAPDRIEPEAVPPEADVPPASAPPPSTRRKTLIASIAVALLAGGGIGWRLLHPAQKIPARPAPAVPAPPAAAAAPVPTPAPATPVTAVPPMTAAPASSPAPIPPRAATNHARRAARARKPKAAVVPPVVPAAPHAPAPAEDSGFLLPGVPRRVPPQSVTKPKAAGAAPAADAAEDGATRQVREQFEFCAQLLAQAAYADHFDTCLCADARKAAPYRGRRASYAAALKKAAAGGALETSASITGIALDGPVAKVTADWKSGAAGKPRAETESWRLEDGLWCRSP